MEVGRVLLHPMQPQWFQLHSKEYVFCLQVFSIVHLTNKQILLKFFSLQDQDRSEIYAFYKKHNPKYKRYVVQCGNEYGDGVFLDLMLDNEDDAVRYAKQVATVFCE